MTEKITNPNQTTIILHGGPKDGTIMEIGEVIAKYGRLIVAIEPDPKLSFNPYDLSDTVHFERGLYERTLMSAGEPGTCEMRYWNEWHWKGKH